MTFIVPRWFRICLVCAHAGFSLVALTASPAAGISVVALSVLTLGRYQSMLAFTRSLRSSKIHAALYAGLWFACIVGLGLLICLVALRARPALPWAAAAVCVGPVAVMAWALFAGLRAVATRSRTPGEPQGGRA